MVAWVRVQKSDIVLSNSVALGGAFLSTQDCPHRTQYRPGEQDSSMDLTVFAWFYASVWHWDGHHCVKYDGSYQGKRMAARV